MGPFTGIFAIDAILEHGGVAIHTPQTASNVDPFFIIGKASIPAAWGNENHWQGLLRLVRQMIAKKFNGWACDLIEMFIDRRLWERGLKGIVEIGPKGN
jgi:hypothetical protein